MKKVFLNGKIFVKNKTNEIQNLLFQLNYQWASGYQKISHESSPFIFFDEYGNMTVSSSTFTFYKTNEHVKEYTIDELKKLLDIHKQN